MVFAAIIERELHDTIIKMMQCWPTREGFETIKEQWAMENIYV